MRRGLSAYPSDSYYDPNRPAWLPFWLDTFQESAAKWGLYPGAQNTPSPPPAPVIAAPQTPGEMTAPGAWTPDLAARRTQAEYQDALRRNAANQTEDEGQSPVVIAAAIGVALWLVGQVSQGGRRRRR